MKRFALACTAAVFLAASGAAFAAPKGGQPGSGTNPGGQGGFVTETMTTTTTESFMGMSDKSPPNAHAGASQGVRTDTTTTVTEVNGPKGQVDSYVDGSSATCNNCTETEISSSTETTDAPGANR